VVWPFRQGEGFEFKDLVIGKEYELSGVRHGQRVSSFWMSMCLRGAKCASTSAEWGGRSCSCRIKATTPEPNASNLCVGFLSAVRTCDTRENAGTAPVFQVCLEG